MCKSKSLKTIENYNYTTYTSYEIRKIAGNILVDDDHKFIMCYSGKVGATNFKTLFVYLSKSYQKKYKGKIVPFTNPQLVHSRWKYYSLRPLRSYDTKGIIFRLQNYYKIMAVRHPFSRLVSFYEDKLKRQREVCGHYQQGLGRKILNLYRKNVTIEESECGNTVTFIEFLRYFTSHNMIDNHVRSFTGRCLPCEINYNHIVKIETINMDQIDILKNIYDFTNTEKASQFLSLIPNHASKSGCTNTNIKKTKTNISEFHSSEHHYRGITKDIYMKVLKKCENDMKPYGYTTKLNRTHVELQCKQPTDSDSYCC